MSHELRTPLNSILILGQQLAENSGVEPDATPGRVRQDDPRGRHRPAQSHQRHSRPVEDRVGHRHGRDRGAPVHAPERNDRAQLPPRGRGAQALVHDESRSEPRPVHHDRSEAPAAGPQEPAVERLQVHVAGRRAAPASVSRRAAGIADHPVAEPGAYSRRVLGHGHRYRHRRRRSSASSSRRSSRPTPARRASTAAPVSDLPSAASSRTCSAASCG